MRDSSLFIAMMDDDSGNFTLTLRPFRQDDVDLLSGLIANQDFMRFSLGVYTREQTLGVLEKVLARQHAVALCGDAPKQWNVARLLRF